MSAPVRRWFRIGLVVLLVAGVVGYGAWRWLTAREPVPATSDYALDLDEIRRLAGPTPGDRPLRVNHVQVGVGALPRGAIFAGEPMGVSQPMSHGAYQVVFADGFGMIDSALDEAGFRKTSPEATYAAAAWADIQKGLGTARWIVLTHEHADHVGGVARHADPQRLVGRLLMTREQLASDGWLAEVKFPDELRRALTPLDYDRHHAVAPGVVLVKAPGHTPGNQMVYVGLADGRELLFLGDVAWHMDQIRELWYRPRLVTDFFLGEDRDAVLAQFRTLHDLMAREPVTLVASHDPEQQRALIEAGLLGDGFEP